MGDLDDEPDMPFMCRDVWSPLDCSTDIVRLHVYVNTVGK